MKKILSIAALIFTSTVINAQPETQSRDPYLDREIFNVCATIFVVGLFMIFILTILKRLLEYRLKNKIVDKGIPESAVSSILNLNNSENKNINIKWFALLAGVGAGLFIVYYTQPLGIHSLAIMSLSVAVSFLGYYIFVRQSGN
jgi:hypothetical protein